MLRVIAPHRDRQVGFRLATVATFLVLMALSAKISIPLEPVPFTLQVLVVLLSGMVLGARDAFFVQMTYVGLIALGLPIDTRSIGAAALFSPTGGFLLGFIPSAVVVGALVTHPRLGKGLVVRWLAGIMGVAIIYLFGMTHLALYTGMGVQRAFEAGVQPFIALDIVKAILAAGLTESARPLLKRMGL